MKKFALVAPTPRESTDLRRELLHEEQTGAFSKGYLNGRPIILTHCGVGKANAAHSTTLLLENYEIDALVLFGIAGAYWGAGVGDIAVARTENYGEEGVMTKEGWKPMDYTGFPLLRDKKDFFNSFPMDEKLTRTAIMASKDIGLNVAEGHFITVSQCSGTRACGETMQKRFNGLCENMEGAAVAHICAIYDIPVIEIRGISNIIEDRDLKKWNIPLAVSNCNKAVSELVRRL